MAELAAGDIEILVWWATQVECASALTRLARAGGLDDGALELALARLNRLAEGWHEVEPSQVVREHAVRFLRVHPLRAADALQLAAAFAASDRRPASIEAVTLDERLAIAMRKEGFAVLPGPGA